MTGTNGTKTRCPGPVGFPGAQVGRPDLHTIGINALVFALRRVISERFLLLPSNPFVHLPIRFLEPTTRHGVQRWIAPG